MNTEHIFSHVRATHVLQHDGHRKAANSKLRYCTEILRYAVENRAQARTRAWAAYIFKPTLARQRKIVYAKVELAE